MGLNVNLNKNLRETNGDSKKIFIQCSSMQLIELIDYLPNAGFNHSQQLSIPEGNLLVLLRDDKFLIKPDSKSIRIWIDKNGYEEASILSEEKEHQYLDKNGNIINVGDVVYYSELPMWNSCDSIGIVRAGSEYFIKMLVKNVDGIYQYCKNDKTQDLYYYSIDDCGTLLETCKNLQVINATESEITVQFATKYFPLKRNFIPNASNIISIGDLVSVNFNNSQYTLTSNGEVLGVPGKDNTWIIKDINTEELFNISEPCTVSKRVL